jgi:hypothetical protein
MPSKIQVNSIESNSPPNIATILPYGCVVSAGYALTCNGGVNIAGVVTATSFSGDGSGLSNLAVVNTGAVISNLIIR